MTPPSLRPAPLSPAAVPGPAAASRIQQAEAGGQLRVVVGRVRLEGGFEELEGAVAAVFVSMAGRSLSVQQLFELASAIESLYLRAGYPLVRISLPPQKLVDGGVVRFVLTDGYVEQVDCERVAARVRAAVCARVASLIGQRRLHNRVLERAVLGAGEVAGVSLRSALGAGKEAGGTRLILEGEHRAVAGHVATDNRQSPSIGRWGLGANIAFNSLLGRGEQIYVSATTPADAAQIVSANSPLRVTGGGAVLPIGIDGLIFNPEYTVTDTRSGGLGLAPLSEGSMRRLALRASYPLVLTRAERLTLNSSLEHLDQQTDLTEFGVRLRHDRYWALRPGLDWSRDLDGFSSLQLSATLSRGLGGRSQKDAVNSGVPLSRQGADPDFTKVAATIAVNRILMEHVSLSLTLKGQTSFGKPLLTSEQFALDGGDALSPFLPGTLSVDEGATARAELQRSFDWQRENGSFRVTPYLFAAAGRGFLRKATALEAPDVSAYALGAGVRILTPPVLDRIAGTAHFELGRQSADLPAFDERWRLSASLALRF